MHVCECIEDPEWLVTCDHSFGCPSATRKHVLNNVYAFLHCDRSGAKTFDVITNHTQTTPTKKKKKKKKLMCLIEGVETHCNVYIAVCMSAAIVFTSL